MTLEGRSLSLASYRGGTERVGNVLRVPQPGGGRTHTQETLALRVGVWSLDSVQCGPLGWAEATWPLKWQIIPASGEIHGWGRESQHLPQNLSWRRVGAGRNLGA